MEYMVFTKTDSDYIYVICEKCGSSLKHYIKYVDSFDEHSCNVNTPLGCPCGNQSDLVIYKQRLLQTPSTKNHSSTESKIGCFIIFAIIVAIFIAIFNSLYVSPEEELQNKQRLEAYEQEFRQRPSTLQNALEWNEKEKAKEYNQKY